MKSFNKNALLSALLIIATATSTTSAFASNAYATVTVSGTASPVCTIAAPAIDLGIATTGLNTPLDTAFSVDVDCLIPWALTSDLAYYPLQIGADALTNHVAFINPGTGGTIEANQINDSGSASLVIVPLILRATMSADNTKGPYGVGAISASPILNLIY